MTARHQPHNHKGNSVSSSILTPLSNPVLNTIGLICPEPIMLLHKTIRAMQTGETLTVVATDPATTRDIPNFCRHLGHTLLLMDELDVCDLPSQDEKTSFDVYYRYVIEKK